MVIKMLLFFIGFVAVIIGVFLLYVFILVRPERRRGTDRTLLCHYAHRGLHGGGVPENSLAAFKKAVAEGYGIEMDLQLSADGEVMVFHDYTLDRMTECEGKLSSYTAAELQSMRLKTAAGVLTEETIPTLRRVLAAVDGAVPLLIELKGESLDASLCPAADAILRDYKGAYCVESFNPGLLFWYRRHRRDVLRGQLYTDVYRDKGKTAHYFLLSLMVLNVFARPQFIACNRLYDENFCVKLTTRLFRAPRLTWTIRSEEERVGGWMIFENIRP